MSQFLIKQQKKQKIMQNNYPIDLEFEISGEKLWDFDYSLVKFSDPKKIEIAKTIHSIILNKAWGLTSIEKLKCQIGEKLNFVDLVKIKLDFSETTIPKYNRKGLIIGAYSVFNAAENLPEQLSDDLFGWVYYNENEKLEMLSFMLNISTGEIKFLLNN